jgi:NAD(P)-dependent dehydrogenase (short-subunit alcohol dehydrogenase family)
MEQAIVIGVGTGLSAAVARRLASAGYAVTLAARDAEKLSDLAGNIGAEARICDATDPSGVATLVAAVPGDLRVAVYNPSYRVRGPVAELDPDEVLASLKVTAFGAFLFAQAAARRMLANAPDARGCRGTILFTGASAGVKGFPQSAPFAMGKFAQRGLAQSMARELHPRGIHVAWVNIDGGIRSDRRPEPDDAPNSMLDPDAIADEYMHLIGQHPSAWSDELSLRPWVERF